MKLKFFAFFLALSTACFANLCLEEKIEFFYLDPKPLTAKEIIKEAKDCNCLDECLGVFTAFARYYPKEVVTWIKGAGISFEKHPHLIDALYMGGLQGEAIQLALNAKLPTQKILSYGGNVQPFLTIPVNFLGSVQYMCSHFYISGDIRYGKKIIDVFNIKPQEMANSEELQELRSQARAVLQELIFKHEKMYQLCLAEAKTRKDASQAILNELLEEQLQAQKKAFPTHNGMLSGTILTTDNTAFEEQWENMSAIEGPVVNVVSSMAYPDTPEKNKTIRVLILFNGYELDKDLHAHLSYDMEILDPEGNKMADFHDLSALKKKVPSRFLSQKADQPIVFAIQFSENDQEPCSPGTFVINATLKDHIAKKDLKLTTTFELLPPE